MLKKMMLLAVAAAAFAAFVAPAAQAAWNDAGTAITSEKSVILTGSAAFSGGTSCNKVESHIDFKPGTTGTITSFVVESPETECEVTNTLKALGCTKLTAETPTNLETPGKGWTIHTDGNVISITEVLFHNTYAGGGLCPKTVTLSGSVTATPNNKAAVSSVTLSGELTSSLGTKPTVSGTLNVLAPNTGTYGI